MNHTSPTHQDRAKTHERGQWLIVAASLLTLLYAVILGGLYLRWPGDGYGVHLSKQGFTVDRATAGGALRKGDTVIRVASASEEWSFDGRLMRPGVWHRRLFGAPDTLTYTVLRDGIELPPLAVAVSRANLGDLVSRTGVLLFLGTVFVFNSLFITLRRGNDRAGRLMALALLAEGLNLINNTINLFSINVSASLYWLFVPLDHLSFWATFGLLPHLFLVFPQESVGVRWGRRKAVILTLHLANPVISGVGGFVLSGGATLALRAAIYQLAYPIAGVQLVLALGLMIRTYKTTLRPLVRSQIRWILWGISLGAAGWLALFAGPIVLTGNPLVDLSVAMIPLVLVPITFTFAVTRYRLLDIDTIINRSLVYGAVSILLVVGYLIDVALISRGLQMLTGRQDNSTVVFMSTLSVALIFVPVRTWVQRGIDRTFYPGKLHFQRLLRQVGGELSTTLALDELVTLLTTTIPERLGIENAVLFVLDEHEKHLLPHGNPRVRHTVPLSEALQNELRDKHTVLADHDEEGAGCLQKMPGVRVCFPLFSRGRLIGLYGFGAKLSGDLYSGEEIDILRALRHQVAIAVENTRLYHQVELYNRSLEDLVRQRTAELAQAHETVAAERNKLDAAINTISDGLVVTDAHGCIVLTNPVFESIVNRPAEQLIGQPLGEVFPNTDLENILRQALSHSERTFTGDLTHGLHNRPAGQHVFRTSACALRAETPPVEGVVTVLRDVTHEVAVDRMKTDFISTVSHELRTPLTSVLGFAKLIRRTFDRDVLPALAENERKLQRAIGRVHDNLDIIESESLRLTRLINDVLDIAKMEAGKIEWRAEEVTMVEIIHKAIASTSALAEQKGLPLLAQINADELPTIIGDPDRLLQVLTNLLSNAIKFTDRGRITLQCQVHNGQLVTSVTDTGIGIAPDDLSAVFERFKQVGDALTDRPRGTGLGLPICKEIVEHHGGAIWAESQPGAGSTFYFTLPLSPLIPHPSPPASRPSPIPDVSTAWVRRRVSERLPATGDTAPLILVVDDEANIRRLLQQELCDAGYRVIEATDGAEALTQTRRQRPNLIILDVMMPGVSGFDVTSALKADPHTADIPILILSIIEDRERGLRLGADEYLTKPVNAEGLLHTVAALLQETEINLQERACKVLVVDEDVSVVEAITRVLRERGLEVVEAYDSRGAIQRAEAEKPDLVILDAMLSKMNDFELLKALRYHHRQHQFSIIVMAGETRQGGE